MVDLRKKPFYLGDREIAWVEDTLERMTFDEKIGQLFCPIGLTTDEQILRKEYLRFGIGGMMFRAGESGEKTAQLHTYLQKETRIPLLLAANLESGGDGIAKDGTPYGNQMLAAAAGSKEYAYNLGLISGREGIACGCNWAFGPVADIAFNPYNPITNVRTYGDDPQTVADMTSVYVKAVQGQKMAACAKHFPGDGVDGRDQHLLTSVNSLECEAWDKTYGMIYQRLIEEGVMTIMAGHIALPGYQKRLGEAYDERFPVPATLSKALLQGLLREKLGFNGLIATDATQMVGFCSYMPREKAVPYAIESGCDMVLFNHSLEEDIGFMKRGYETGILSKERLLDAVKRILGLKAALGLPWSDKEISEKQLEMLHCEEHGKMAKEAAGQSVTLVRDYQNILPLHPQKYRRIYLQVMTNDGNEEVLEKQFTELLEKEGFEVEAFRPVKDCIFLTEKVEDFKKKYDLVLYIMDIENKSNHTTSRIQWDTMYASNNQPWFVCEIPTVMVSMANPYHLIDAPMVRTYINAYYNSEYTRQAVIEKITGREQFRGKNPVNLEKWEYR